MVVIVTVVIVTVVIATEVIVTVVIVTVVIVTVVIVTVVIVTVLNFYFLITFGKSNLTHLTTDVMFSGQRFAIFAMFLA
jgi:hypothetical protein